MSPIHWIVNRVICDHRNNVMRNSTLQGEEISSHASLRFQHDGSTQYILPHHELINIKTENTMMINSANDVHNYLYFSDNLIQMFITCMIPYFYGIDEYDAILLIDHRARANLVHHTWDHHQCPEKASMLFLLRREKRELLVLQINTRQFQVFLIGCIHATAEFIEKTLPLLCSIIIIFYVVAHWIYHISDESHEIGDF